MALTTENTLEQRIARVDAAVALREGDRVPMAPKIGMAYAQTAGTTGTRPSTTPGSSGRGWRNFCGPIPATCSGPGRATPSP